MSELVVGEYVTPWLRLVAPLGQGAMGSVWIAEHVTLRSRVAVKFLLRALADEPECVERFAREASAAAQVRSPHVVQVLDYGVGDGELPYIVMELLDGCDLGERLRREHRLPLGQVVSIVVQACKALSVAHARGVIHRDIKPENIFLCDDASGTPFVKLLDFGIAKAIDHAAQLTRGGVWLGSPSYMSPEQIDAPLTINGRSDLWGLGVVAYEALTGVRPFRADSLPEVLKRIRSGAFDPPSKLVPSLPPEVDAWFARAIARNPGERFPTAREMSDALVHAVSRVQLADTLVAPSIAFPLLRPRDPVEHVEHLEHVERPSVRDVVPEHRPRWPWVVASGLLVVGGGVGYGVVRDRVLHEQHRQYLAVESPRAEPTDDPPIVEDSGTPEVFVPPPPPPPPRKKATISVPEVSDASAREAETEPEIGADSAEPVDAVEDVAEEGVSD